MLMVISPAKTLDYETPPATPRFTQPEHLDHAQELIAQLREFSPAQIAELMGLSDKLAGLNASKCVRRNASSPDRPISDRRCRDF